jgi:shikimate kinase
MNIVLIGYRGTGKSTVANLLGHQLNRKVISTDADIVHETGQTIPQLVEQHGWDYFRGLETQVCQRLVGEDNLIVDTGGGLVLKEENLNILKTRGKFVWLTAEVPTIVARIGGDSQRPSLSGTKSFVEEVEEILAIRQPHYQAAADVIIPTDQKTPETIASEIVEKLLY